MGASARGSASLPKKLTVLLLLVVLSAPTCRAAGNSTNTTAEEPPPPPRPPHPPPLPSTNSTVKSNSTFALSSNSTTFDILSQLKKDARELFGNRTLRCADFRILRDGSTPGDGFARLAKSEITNMKGDPNKTATGRGIMQSQVTPFKISTDRLDGVNVVMLNKMASLGDFNIDYYIHHVSDNMMNGSKRVVFDHLMSVYDYDCIITPTTLAPDWLGFMRFLPTHMNAGYAVFAPGPVIEGAPNLLDSVFSWVTPFSGRTWALMLGALLAVGITMSILESSANHEDFPGTTSVSKLVHIWNGAYLSVAGFTSKTEEFSPKTIPGRILGLLNSFAVWLALAMYIANLAAVFTNGQMMVEPILDITSFVTQNVPACISESFDLRQFLGEKYPNTQLQMLDPVVYGTSGSGRDNLPIALANGDCIGGVTVDISFRDSTSPLNDPGGDYCNLLQKGFVLNSISYAMAVNKRFSKAEQDALDFLATEAMSSAEFVASVADNFPTDREQCGQPTDQNSAVPDSLSVEQMAGVFLIQGIGCVAAFLWLGLAKVLGVSVLPGQSMLRKSKEGHKSGRDSGLALAAANATARPSGARAANGNAVAPADSEQQKWRVNPARASSGAKLTDADPIDTIRVLLDRLEKERNNAYP